MNKLAAVLLFAVSFTAHASVYGFIEPRTTTSRIDGVSDTYEEVYGFASYGGTVGGFVFAQSNLDSSDELFRQAYAGPYWRPTKWLEVGVGYGVEQFDGDDGEVSSSRFGSYIDLTTDFGYAELVFEDGDSGYYSEYRLSYEPNDWVGVGGIYFRHLGYGPRIELKIPVMDGTTLNLWGAYLWGEAQKDQPANTFVLSGQLVFDL